MKREDVLKLITTLENFKKLNQHARLTPGDVRHDASPRGWWVREENE
jgi:hypothetical protein